MTSTSKYCTKCGRNLPLSEFNRDSGEKDGLQRTCRDCFSAYNRARYASNREKFKRDVAAYQKSHPGRVLQTRLSISEKSPTLQNAARVIEAALKAGEIERPEYCTGCGCHNTEHRIEAHHPDYTRPLFVSWLCTPCHKAIHKSMNERGRTPHVMSA